MRFTLKDLRQDAAARREFLDRGFRLPPVTVVGEIAVEGFQPDRLEALLDPGDG